MTNKANLMDLDWKNGDPLRSFIFQIMFVVFAFMLTSIDAQTSDNQQSSGSSFDQAMSKIDNKDNVKGQDTSLQTEAFSSLPSIVAPLTPDQVKEIRQLYNNMQRAGVYEGGDAPSRPTSSSLVVNLSPGATPPVVRLSAGYVTSLVFLDRQSKPWPIKAYSIGNPSAFNIQWNKETPKEDKLSNTMLNTLLIQAQTLYKPANLAVVLQGLNVPVMITLIPGQQVVDYRVDMHIPRSGPFGDPVADTLPGHSVNNVVMDVLNNVTPSAAVRLHVKGGEADAWKINGHLYVRTRLKVISPGWMSSISGADDMVHVYELPQAPVLLAIDNGRVIKLTIEGF